MTYIHRFSLAFMLILLLFGCEPKSAAPWQKFLEDENVIIIRDDKNRVVAAKTYKDGEQHGVTERYYPTGDLASRRYFVAGVEQGISEFFYDTGQLKVRQPFVDGLPEGDYTSYYPTGELRRIKKFYKGLAIGESPSYFPNGKIQAIEHFKNGKLHGKIDYFNNSGKLIKRSTYITGTLISNEYPNAEGGLDKQIIAPTAISN